MAMTPRHSIAAPAVRGLSLRLAAPAHIHTYTPQNLVPCPCTMQHVGSPAFIPRPSLRLISVAASRQRATAVRCASSYQRAGDGGSLADRAAARKEQPNGRLCYSEPVEELRQREYPHMSSGIYLDHSGATIYARSLVDGFAARMTSSLYGNPHSVNGPAKVSGDMVDEVRLRALRFLGADPKHFDLVFVANATAAIKLVADSFRDLAEKTWKGSFWFGYHKDSHTSIVGVRELAGRGDARCFSGDGEVEGWLSGDHGGGVMGRHEHHRHHSHHHHSQQRRHHRSSAGLGLFAYPGQSNMSGRRLPLSWPGKLRASGVPHHSNTYSLLDAAALAMTKPMSGVFADPAGAPDFTCLSFYKIFGFPDLGALVVRRDSGHILTLRRYFGGGTVTMVSTLGGAWHRSKGLEGGGVGDEGGGGGGGDGRRSSEVGGGAQKSKYSIHDGLEDGTLPFHSILALGEAIDVHGRLYGSMENVSRHTTALGGRLFDGVSRLRHGNGRPVCQVYGDEGLGDGVEEAGGGFGDPDRQGATIAFNVVREDGSFVPYADVENAANERGIYIRSGGICCPGGMFTALGYEPWELERAMSAGHHCGPEGLSLINQLPTGVVRASLGPMSTARDVETFVTFLQETFVENQQQQQLDASVSPRPERELVVERRQEQTAASFG